MLVGVYFPFPVTHFDPATPCHSPFQSKETKGVLDGLSLCKVKENIVIAIIFVVRGHPWFGLAGRTGESMVLIRFDILCRNQWGQSPLEIENR